MKFTKETLNYILDTFNSELKQEAELDNALRSFCGDSDFTGFYITSKLFDCYLKPIEEILELKPFGECTSVLDYYITCVENQNYISGCMGNAEIYFCDDGTELRLSNRGSLYLAVLDQIKRSENK